MVQDIQRIVLDPSGAARFEVRRSVPSSNGEQPRERVIEEKHATIAALLGRARESPILPLHCRFHDALGPQEVFVIEDAPQTRVTHWRVWDTIVWRARERPCPRAGEDAAAYAHCVQTQQDFRIALPYFIRIYAFTNGVLDKVYCYFRNDTLRSLRDELFVCNLPNVYEAHHSSPMSMCLPRGLAQRIAAVSGTPASVIEEVESAIFGGGWNAELTHLFESVAQRIPELSSPWHWEAASLQDALFILRVPWDTAQETVGAKIASILEAQGRGRGMFSDLARNIREAEHWDANAAAVAAQNGRASPSRIVAVECGELFLGDVITIARGVFPQFPNGGTFPIEWFGYAEGTDRAVKLVGVDALLPIIVRRRLAHGVSVAAREEDTIVLDGIPIGRGAQVYVPATPAWAHLGQGWRSVTEARRDASGETLVLLDRASTMLAITSGGVLADGMRIAPREDVDAVGFLIADHATLRDGTEIRVGDSFYSCAETFDAVSCRALRVERLFPRSRDAGRFLRLAELSDGAAWRMEGEDGHLTTNFMRVPDAPVEFATMSGGVTLRIGDRLRTVWTWTSGTFEIAAFTPVWPRRGQHFVRLVGQEQWHLLDSRVFQRV